LEWCENRLLENELPARRIGDTASPAQYELFANFTAEELAVVTALLKRRIYQRSETIIRAGDDARELFFLARGSVSVFIALPSGAQKRLATFSPGMSFGEMAVIDRAPRSAMIVADTEVECDLLTVEDIEPLGQTYPGIKIKLLENLCLGLCRKLRKANRELSTFE
jgi:glutaminase